MKGTGVGVSFSFFLHIASPCVLQVSAVLAMIDKIVQHLPSSASLVVISFFSAIRALSCRHAVRTPSRCSVPVEVGHHVGVLHQDEEARHMD